MPKKKELEIMPHGKHIKIIIAVEGECAVDAINFIGPACQAATMEITAALGGQIERQHDKPEARFRERSAASEREGAR
jgi:hypothetical protein